MCSNKTQTDILLSLRNYPHNLFLFYRNDATVITEPNHAPPRSRRSSVHSNGGLDIPAASAVAGVLAASPELPYMTPPVTQANFSGDSQDSSSKLKIERCQQQF